MGRNLKALPHAPRRVPLLGDVFTASARTPTQHETEWAKQLGPIFERKLLHHRLVIVAGSDAAHQLTDETHWGRVLAGPAARLRTLAPEGLFGAKSNSAIWHQAHNVLTPGFALTAMTHYHGAMCKVVDRLAAYWSEAGEVTVTDSATRLTAGVIAEAGFGYRLGDFTAPVAADPFLAALGRWLEWASESANEMPIIGGVLHRGRGKQLAADKAILRQTVADIIAARGDSRPEPADLLDLMLHTEDPDTGKRLPPENVEDQILTFLIAGHETTASLLESALYYLAADPELAATARAEVAAVAGGGPIPYSAVAKLRTVRAIVNECLRLWPPAPGYFRIARTDAEIAGYSVRRGQVVFLLALAAQRDPDVWGPDAAQFRPGRFHGKPKGFFKPFGTGPRACIGRQFALHEATLALAMLLRAFTLRMPEGETLKVTERGALRPAPFRIHATSIRHTVHNA